MTDVVATPQDRVAAMFMERKGYPRIAPQNVERLEGLDCWYYYYDLPEGTLELEVLYSAQTWETMVTAFTARPSA